MTDSESGGTAGRRVQAVETSCEILGELRERDEAGISELADTLDQSKATIHSHLQTLLDQEFVVRRGDKYALSLRFVDFGEHAKTGLEIYDIAKTEVERLADETGEVAQFMIEEHGRGVYLHKARGDNAIQTSSYIGNRKNLHCTALGKAILSQLPDERVEEIIDQTGMPQHTSHTVTTRAELFEEIDRIRETGVAFDDEEALRGLRCVAAPVDNHVGHRAAAISVSGPTSRFKNERFREEFPELVRSAANVIEVNAAQV